MRVQTPSKRKAVSPVIATVILVAVAITIAVAVANWMGGISGQYTQFEKCEIQSAVCTLDSVNNWNITVKIKNSGTKTATLTNIFVNEFEVSTYGASAPTAAVSTITTDLPTAGLSIESGAIGTIKVWVGVNYGSLSSGTTVNVKLHSAGGMDYIKLVSLP